jgi:hypothetical protein
MNPLIICLLVIILFSIINYYIIQTENYKNYLYPIKGLDNECEKKGLNPAFMPTVCVKDGKMNTFANCKCVDKKTGKCKICYPEIRKDEKGRSVIYNAQDIKLNSEDQ